MSHSVGWSEGSPDGVLVLTSDIGNAVGNVILFEPSTKEHLSTRTIYDPITALAPASDNHTFAIGSDTSPPLHSFANANAAH